MGTRYMGILTAAVLLPLAPTVASGQTPGDAAGWWEWALPAMAAAYAQERGGVWMPGADHRAAREWERRQRGIASPRGGARQQAGPPFCRAGAAGHPVHGRRWCAEKGFGTGGLPLPRWEPVRWEDIVFGRPDRHPSGRRLHDRTLVDILGDVVYGRIAAEGRVRGGGQPMTGRWYRPAGSRGSVLQIRAGGVPIAELTDLTGDGRVDAVLLNRSLR